MKLYIVYVEDYFDFEALDKRVCAYTNEEQAKEAFQAETSYAHDMLIESKNTYWVVNENETNFEAYPDGEWGTSHYIVTLRTLEVKDSMGGSINVSPNV